MHTYRPVAHNGLCRGNGTKREARGDTLTESDYIRHYLVVLHSKPFPCASHPGLYLIGNQHYAVVGAELSELLHIGTRWYGVTAFAKYRFYYYAGDLARCYQALEDIVDLLEAFILAFALLLPYGASIAVRIGGVVDRWQKRMVAASVFGA